MAMPAARSMRDWEKKRDAGCIAWLLAVVP